MDACKAACANHPLSGLKPITGTNTVAVPAPDGPLGLDGKVTSTHSNTDRKGEGGGGGD